MFLTVLPEMAKQQNKLSMEAQKPAEPTEDPHGTANDSQKWKPKVWDHQILAWRYFPL